MAAERKSLMQAIKSKRDVKKTGKVNPKKQKTDLNDAEEPEPRTHAVNVRDHKEHVKK